VCRVQRGDTSGHKTRVSIFSVTKRTTNLKCPQQGKCSVTQQKRSCVIKCLYINMYIICRRTRLLSGYVSSEDVTLTLIRTELSQFKFMLLDGFRPSLTNELTDVLLTFR
jgi:hypothetical protein